jgi:hypothetical protein
MRYLWETPVRMRNDRSLAPNRRRAANAAHRRCDARDVGRWMLGALDADEPGAGFDPQS